MNGSEVQRDTSSDGYTIGTEIERGAGAHQRWCKVQDEFIQLGVDLQDPVF